MIASTKAQQVDRFGVWSPPRSPARIEYVSALLDGIHVGGELFGTRIEGGFRVLEVRNGPDENEAGLESLGIFASRVRGEVFLTESDLQRLGRRPLALVVVGDRAGFFIREPDGSMVTIQSYQEFSRQTNSLKAVRRGWRIRRAALP